MHRKLYDGEDDGDGDDDIVVKMRKIAFRPFFARCKCVCAPLCVFFFCSA